MGCKCVAVHSEHYGFWMFMNFNRYIFVRRSQCTHSKKTSMYTRKFIVSKCLLSIYIICHFAGAFLLFFSSLFALFSRRSFIIPDRWKYVCAMCIVCVCVGVKSFPPKNKFNIECWFFAVYFGCVAFWMSLAHPKQEVLLLNFWFSVFEAKKWGASSITDVIFNRLGHVCNVHRTHTENSEKVFEKKKWHASYLITFSEREKNSSWKLHIWVGYCNSFSTTRKSVRYYFSKKTKTESQHIHGKLPNVIWTNTSELFLIIFGESLQHGK